MTQTVVILGASFAGLKSAHGLLKDTLPKTPGGLKVVLVSTSTHVYMNPASVRAIIPGQFTDETYLKPIDTGFAKYPSGSFELIVGKAEKVDDADNKVLVKKSDGKDVLLRYDFLIVATGSRVLGDVPWKTTEGYEKTTAAIHAMQDLVKNASSIVIGGGGETGVETMGELGSEYAKTKELTLITSGSAILPSFPAKLSASAKNTLESMGINVVLDTKILSTTVLASGKTELKLSNNTTKIVDLYLPAIGVQPNSSFLPASWLNKNGFVMVDEYLAVKDVTSHNVFSVGDVSDRDAPTLTNATAQAGYVVKALHSTLTADKAAADAALKYVSSGPKGGATLGRSKGIGHFAGWSVPSIMIWFIKGRQLWTNVLPQVIDGTAPM